MPSFIRSNYISIMRKGLLLPFVITTLSVFIYSCSDSTNCDTNADCSTVTFSGTIQPLAESKCALSGCHGTTFDSYSNLSGLADNGDLFQEVVATQNMPDGNITMTCEERSQFECWINDGAPNN